MVNTFVNTEIETLIMFQLLNNIPTNVRKVGVSLKESVIYP